MTETAQSHANPQIPELPRQPSSQPVQSVPGFQWKLWIYTNYDCHLRCTYCLAESSPQAA